MLFTTTQIFVVVQFWFFSIL